MGMCTMLQRRLLTKAVKKTAPAAPCSTYRCAWACALARLLYTHEYTQRPACAYIGNFLPGEQASSKAYERTVYKGVEGCLSKAQGHRERAKRGGERERESRRHAHTCPRNENAAERIAKHGSTCAQKVFPETCIAVKCEAYIFMCT